MFLNCGQVLRSEDGVRIEIWEGTETYEFRIAHEDLRRLLQDEKPVPVRRKFGLLENPNYGRAMLVGPEGHRKGVVFRVDCFPKRGFSLARAALTHVARGRWHEAAVSEMIPDPLPRACTVRMGVVR